MRARCRPARGLAVCGERPMLPCPTPGGWCVGNRAAAWLGGSHVDMQQPRHACPTGWPANTGPTCAQAPARRRFESSARRSGRGSSVWPHASSRTWSRRQPSMKATRMRATSRRPAGVGRGVAEGSGVGEVTAVAGAAGAGWGCPGCSCGRRQGALWQAQFCCAAPRLAHTFDLLLFSGLREGFGLT